MIPEIGITCGDKRHFISSITLGQYRRYVSLMEKNRTEKFADVMFFNKRIVQELFGGMSFQEVGAMDAVEFLAAAKAIHFVMQDIITRKMLNIVEAEQVEREASAFNEYDIENGYEEEQPEENQWKICGEIADRIVKVAIRLLRNSYSQCMGEDVVTLLDYLKFELDTIHENQ